MSSEQVTFTVPAPLTGTPSPNTTVWESSLQLAIGTRATAPQPLPIVYEPNGSYLGSMSAPVTMVEYGDYQCPFCDLFYLNTWPALKSEYVGTGKVRFLFQDMAFCDLTHNLAGWQGYGSNAWPRSSNDWAIS
jgi:protein-disulfide isomerase